MAWIVQLILACLFSLNVSCHFYRVSNAVRTPETSFTNLDPVNYLQKLLHGYGTGYDYYDEDFPGGSYNIPDLGDLIIERRNHKVPHDLRNVENPSQRPEHRDPQDYTALNERKSQDKHTENLIPNLTNSHKSYGYTGIDRDESIVSQDKVAFTNDNGNLYQSKESRSENSGTSTQDTVPKIIYVQTDGLQDNQLYQVAGSSGDSIIMSRAQTNKGPLYYIVKPNNFNAANNLEQSTILPQTSALNNDASYIIRYAHKQPNEFSNVPKNNDDTSNMNFGSQNSNHQSTHNTIRSDKNNPTVDNFFTNANGNRKKEELDLNQSYKNPSNYEKQNIQPIILVLANPYMNRPSSDMSTTNPKKGQTFNNKPNRGEILNTDKNVKGGEHLNTEENLQNSAEGDNDLEDDVMKSIIAALKDLPAITDQDFKVIKIITNNAPTENSKNSIQLNRDAGNTENPMSSDEISTESSVKQNVPTIRNRANGIVNNNSVLDRKNVDNPANVRSNTLETPFRVDDGTELYRIISIASEKDLNDLRKYITVNGKGPSSEKVHIGDTINKPLKYQSEDTLDTQKTANTSDASGVMNSISKDNIATNVETKPLVEKLPTTNENTASIEDGIESKFMGVLANAGAFGKSSSSFGDKVENIDGYAVQPAVMITSFKDNN
ncbi:asparagine-rich protein-like [Bombyx mandarina]|uniref:Asparagine-rich protein-like n=1 Tax=Bombyx mandarina TaxID=7092 RepID=A0A6J2K2D5_BOMMA|nr:asparagine-rich protein-like [Bombyx mandarina]